jgi:hypothetical protein
MTVVIVAVVLLRGGRYVLPFLPRSTWDAAFFVLLALACLALVVLAAGTYAMFRNRDLSGISRG